MEVSKHYLKIRLDRLKKQFGISKPIDNHFLEELKPEEILTLKDDKLASLLLLKLQQNPVWKEVDFIFWEIYRRQPTTAAARDLIETSLEIGSSEDIRLILVSLSAESPAVYRGLKKETRSKLHWLFFNNDKTTPSAWFVS